MHCKDCKHWKPHETYINKIVCDYGICQNSEHLDYWLNGNAMVKNARQGNYKDKIFGDNINTGKDFGCIKFKTK